MKRILLIFIIFINSLFAKEYVIGFAQDTFDNDWRLAQVNEVKDAVSKHKNLKLIVKNAEAKVSNQIRHIEEFIKNDVDFIITSPINAHITSLVLKKAIKKGIKVILIDRNITSKDYTSFISADNSLIAQDAAKFLLKKMNYKGTILMLQGIKGASATIQRENGFEEISKNYPEIKIIKKRANFLRNDAIKVMEEIYKNNIKFDAIYSHSDSMLIGAREVIKKFDNKISIPTVGIDYIKNAKIAILKNEQSASFIYKTAGKEGVQTILDIINKKEIQKEQILETQIITKENVKKFEPIF